MSTEPGTAYYANSGFQMSITYNCVPAVIGCESDDTGIPNNVQSFAAFDYTFRPYSTVPEPATVSLIGAALVVLFGVAKRRRRGVASTATEV